jgi:hypothetical protein
MAFIAVPFYVLSLAEFLPAQSALGPDNMVENRDPEDLAASAMGLVTSRSSVLGAAPDTAPMRLKDILLLLLPRFMQA